jgi:hypothetical protein
MLRSTIQNHRRLVTATKPVDLVKSSGVPLFHPLSDIESAITCNTLYLANATRVSPSYGYEYAVGMYPYHGLDLCWTFAPNFKLQLKGVNICTSLYPGNKAQFQRYLVNFAMAGDPNSGQSQPKVNWNAFGTTGSVLKIQGIAGFSNVVDDEVPKDRCGFWQNATYCTTCSSSSV